MRRISLAAAALLVSSLATFAAEHAAPPAQDASHYAAVDHHPAEGVAVAVDPYDTKERAAIFRVPYPDYHIVPVRIIVTNSGDQPISLADARIDLITASGDKIPAAEPGDVQRVLSRPKDPTGGYKVGPLKLGGKNKSKDKLVQDDFDSFEYSAIAVEPHSTRAGFLFYDVQDTLNPLQGARLELRKLRAANGKELFAFEVPFDKALAARAQHP